MFKPHFGICTCHNKPALIVVKAGLCKTGNQDKKEKTKKRVLKISDKEDKKKVFNALKTLHKSDKISTLVSELDKWFSYFIRLRDADENGIIICVSCKKPVHWTNANNCHYMERQYKPTRFDEDNCAGGCVACNKWNANFHIHEFKNHLIKKFGADKPDLLKAKSRQRGYKYDPFVLKHLIAHYKKIVEADVRYIKWQNEK